MPRPGAAVRRGGRWRRRAGCPAGQMGQVAAVGGQPGSRSRSKASSSSPSPGGRGSARPVRRRRPGRPGWPRAFEVPGHSGRPSTAGRVARRPGGGLRAARSVGFLDYGRHHGFLPGRVVEVPPRAPTALDLAAPIGPRLAKAAVAPRSTATERDLTKPLPDGAPSTSSPPRPTPAATCCATRRPTSWPRPSRSSFPARSSPSARPRERLPPRLRPAWWPRPSTRRPGAPSRRRCARSSRRPAVRAQRPGAPTRPATLFADQPYKCRDHRAAPPTVRPRQRTDAGEVAAGETISVYRNARVRRPVPRPARAQSTSKLGSFKLDACRRRVLARQREGPDAAAHLRHGVGVEGRARRAPPPAGRGGEA